MSVALALTASAADNIVYQQFFNLTKEELKIDTLLPEFTYKIDLSGNYNDSIYTIKLVYPGFAELSSIEEKDCKKIIEKGEFLAGNDVEFIPRQSGYKLFAGLNQQVTIDRKKGRLEIFFVPIVTDGKKYKKLTDFMLRICSEKKKNSSTRQNSPQIVSSRAEGQTYADHSVLATGRWAKISVKESGIHELTSAVIKKAGFSNLSKVKVYGYGGNLQPEAIQTSYLASTDDLHEVMTYNVNGRRLFRAEGPVHYSQRTSTRTRNPYSDYGCYFITESDTEPLTGDSTAFAKLCETEYPEQFHSLYEVDDFAWYQGGRNLYNKEQIETGKTQNFAFDLSEYPDGTKFTARIIATAGNAASFSVMLNDKVIDTGSIILRNYDKANSGECYFEFEASGKINIGVRADNGGPLHLDYIDICGDKRKKSATYSPNTPIPAAEYVYNISNQDLHSHRDYEMVIIIPTTQKLRSQAERLKTFHETNDSMKVVIVPADEIFNEFSSGTPDANAYRRYLKMLYDRAQTDKQMPKYLLLFGAGAFDNRMKSSYWKGNNPDDYLLCFESENSFSETKCYVNDGFYTLLDDGEGTRQTTSDREDVAVGRLPVTNIDEAKTAVDKIIRYSQNENSGSWQNTVMCLGDDGNNNTHMDDANVIATTVEECNPNMYVRRVMWDTFKREASSTGFSYPEITKLILAQINEGALIIDYSGHGRADQLSHEKVITKSILENITNENLAFWIAAACDVTPYDHRTEHLGTITLFNKNGGSIGFLSTARSAFPTESRAFVKSFITALFKKTNGVYNTIGEAQRLAKNDLISSGKDRSENKLHYSITGDPAMRLNIPTQQVIIDSINGVKVNGTEAVVKMKAASVSKITGHIEKNGVKDNQFNGLANIIIRDAKKKIICKLNDTSSEGAQEPYVYYDRTSTMFKGNTGVTNGDFTIVFAMPKDIDYSGATGLITAFATDSKTHISANGNNESFEASETEDVHTDSIGPSIYCYLNSPNFQDGGDVNNTPFFYAEITDKDGINTASGSIGHDLQLVIEGDVNKTYILNDNFRFDLGSYTKGTTYYNIPTLSPGKHTLRFKAWDILNNSSTTTLAFNVVDGLAPQLQEISCTKNPARESTSFIITHDRKGSPITADIEVMTMAGVPLWKKTTHDSSVTGNLKVDWDLTIDGGGKLQTGVYLYRVTIYTENSTTVSKAKKLIIIN